jgi:hypothetical protein
MNISKEKHSKNRKQGENSSESSIEVDSFFKSKYDDKGDYESYYHYKKDEEDDEEDLEGGNSDNNQSGDHNLSQTNKGKDPTKVEDYQSQCMFDY